MDSITHIVHGGCIGELLLGKKIGRKAVLWGALAQSLPDIDVITAFWMPPSAAVLAHRGFTHSFLFVGLVTPLLAWLAWRSHRAAGISYRRWLLFFGVELLTHLLLDGFNAYGTGWFEPFSHYRVSFQTLFVADPLFTIAPLIAFIVLLFRVKRRRVRMAWAWLGLLASTFYLSTAIYRKLRIDQEVSRQLQRQEIPYHRFFATPTPFNTFLWFIAAETDRGYYLGYRSVFDPDGRLSLQFFPRNDSLLQPFRKRRDVQRLLRFSRGYYTVEKKQGALLFNDLLFGQQMGWEDPQASFVFYYRLQRNENTMLVQRGRWKGWKAEAWQSFWRRIWR